MKYMAAVAVAFALALAGPASAAAPKISKSVAPALQAAQTAAQQGKWQDALTQARAAQAIPDRTPFDDVTINDFIGLAAVNLKDFKTATVAFEAAADNPANSDMDPNDRVGLYHNALLLAADAQHWQKVVAYGQVLEGLNKMDDVTDVEVAVAYYNLKDTARAQQYAQKSIDAAKAAGKQPQENALKIVMNAQAAANPAAAEQTLQQLVMRTNAPDDWGRLIDHTFGAKGMNDVTAMDLYRLKFVTRSLRKDDSSLAGKLANELYFYGDAVQILEGAGITGADLNAARTGAARERGSLNVEVGAAQKGSGQDAIRVAEALYGYGRYAEAESLARAAMSKGLAVKGKCRSHCDPAEAALLIGMSQAAQGKNADAVATFNSVKGSDADMKTAHLWSMYAQLKGGGTAPAATPGH